MARLTDDTRDRIWWMKIAPTANRDVRKAEITDIDDIIKTIQKVRLPAEVFLKATREGIKKRIHYSYVCTENDKIIGCCLIDYKKYDTPTKVWVIDTIVSTKRGAGSLLLSRIPDFEYHTSIHKDNDRSIGLFKKHGFKEIKDRLFSIQGYERLRFKRELING